MDKVLKFILFMVIVIFVDYFIFLIGADYLLDGNHEVVNGISNDANAQVFDGILLPILAIILFDAVALWVFSKFLL